MDDICQDFGQQRPTTWSTISWPFLCASTKYLDKQLLFEKHPNKKRKNLDLEALEVESTLGYFEKKNKLQEKDKLGPQK